MAIYVSNEAERNILGVLEPFFESCEFRLFANNVTPDEDTVLGDFVEPTDSGYAPVSGTAFSTPATDGSGVGYTGSDLVVFTGADPLSDVYGYNVIFGGGLLIYSERFQGAPLQYGAGAPIAFSSRFTLKQQGT